MDLRKIIIFVLLISKKFHLQMFEKENLVIFQQYKKLARQYHPDKAGPEFEEKVCF